MAARPATAPERVDGGAKRAQSEGSEPPKKLRSAQINRIDPSRLKWRPGGSQRLKEVDGGAERDRTADLVIANDALSQLSYSPASTSWNMAFPLRGGAKNGGRMGPKPNEVKATALSMTTVKR